MGFSQEARGYLWGIRFRNDYETPVSFNYKLTIGEESRSKTGFQPTRVLRKGEVWTDGADLSTAKLFNSSSTEYFIYLDKVCFDGMQCGGVDECYADCDRVLGKPNQPCGIGSSSSDRPERVSTPVDEGKPTSINGKWEKEDKSHTFEIELVSDGLILKNIDGRRFGFKKVAPDAYRLGDGPKFIVLKILNDNRFSYWDTGNLIGYYNRVVDGEVPPKLTFDGDWVNESSDLTRWITVLSETGQTLFLKANEYDKEPVRLVKTSANTFEGSENTDLYTITFLSNDRFVENYTNTATNSRSVSYYRRKNLPESAKTNSSNENRISDANSGKWESEAKSVIGESIIIDIVITVDGLTAKYLIPPDQNWTKPIVYKKIGVDSYEQDTKATTIKFISSNKMIWTESGSVPTYYHRSSGSSTGETKSPSIGGIWIGDNGITGTIVLKDGGFNWTNQGGEAFPAFFKKISADAYRFDDANNFCIVKFMSDTKLDYSCNGTHYAFFTRRK